MSDGEEPMDCSDSGQSSTSHAERDESSEQPHASTSHVKRDEKEEIQVTLSVKWPEGDPPQKSKIELQKALQTWANKESKFHGDCTVLNVSKDGRAVIKIKTTPAVGELQELSGQTLTRKDGKTVTITSVSLTPPELETQTPNSASVNVPPPSVSEPQHEQEPLKEQTSSNSPAAVSTAEEATCSCPVPVSLFWYVNQIYKEEIQRIERENGVKIVSEVNVKFEGDQKDGGPQKALSEFTNLVQKSFSESDGSTFPLNFVDPEEFKNTLKIIQRPESKVLLALSSEEMTVCGPLQSQEAIKKSLNLTQNILFSANTSAGESPWESQDTSLKISMNINDPLLDTGLTMEADGWKLMTTSFNEQVAKIKTKFGVDFKVSDISQGEVKVTAHFKRSGGSTSMESHAVRALLHLYQRISTSPMSFTQLHGATGFSDTPKNLSHVDPSEGASSGPVLNGPSGYSTRNTEPPKEEGATAGDSKDEKCPICMDSFIKKKQLKCKHEFCKECLAQSKKSMGPICPVCRDVFGMIEGNQPDGNMSVYVDTSSSLPGFQGCSTIVITYDIPGGRQTEKHPNPGKYYSSINRTAYLPNNKEGNEVLRLLTRAFEQKLIFTIGTSRTTGADNAVTWNDIHHKTSKFGGQQGFGYPDPDYLSRVREELKAKGIE